MSSHTAMRLARGGRRFSKLSPLRPISRPKLIGLTPPSYVRSNSSGSSVPAQNTPSESIPATVVVEDLSSGKDTELHKALTPSGGRELPDKVGQSAEDLKELNRQFDGFRSALRAAASVTKGKQWPVIPHGENIAPLKLEVKFEDNIIRVGSQKVPNIWLRDNCQCKSCVHEETRQRLLDTFSIPEDISIKTGAELTTQIEITWSDGHKSIYDKDFLKDAGADSLKRAFVRQGQTPAIALWDNSVANKKPQIDWRKPNATDPQQASASDVLIQHVLSKIRRYGFCYVTNVPPTPEATEALLKRISFIRETHYGGFYDFTADLASKDTAYTNIALSAHTDNTYFSDPAGLQAFHLLSHTDGEGGASLLVDGFKAAKDLLDEDEEAYRVLATVNVHAHASGNDGISIQPYKGFPVLEHDDETGLLLRVRWNVSDRAAIELPLEDVGKWYAAARKFDTILKRQENEYWEQLQPGSVLIFDNWRVLHGRSAFTGKRRICGGYINRDDWISKYKMMQFGKDEVLGRLASG